VKRGFRKERKHIFTKKGKIYTAWRFNEKKKYFFNYNFSLLKFFPSPRYYSSVSCVLFLSFPSIQKLKRFSFPVPVPPFSSPFFQFNIFDSSCTHFLLDNTKDIYAHLFPITFWGFKKHFIFSWETNAFFKRFSFTLCGKLAFLRNISNFSKDMNSCNLGQQQGMKQQQIAHTQHMDFLKDK